MTPPDNNLHDTSLPNTIQTSPGWTSKPAEDLPPMAKPLPVTQAPYDPVNHPVHYTSHPSGVECIQITEHYNFCVGNALKYLWRAGLKGDTVEDLKKARWYIDREIARRENGTS